MKGLIAMIMKRKTLKVKKAELPPDVLPCLETASLVTRHHRDDGPRTIIMIDGNGWVHSDEETRSRLLRLWPELDKAQLARAFRFLRARIQNETPGAPKTRRKSWALDW